MMQKFVRTKGELLSSIPDMSIGSTADPRFYRQSAMQVS